MDHIICHSSSLRKCIVKFYRSSISLLMAFPRPLPERTWRNGRCHRGFQSISRNPLGLECHLAEQPWPWVSSTECQRPNPSAHIPFGTFKLKQMSSVQFLLSLRVPALHMHQWWAENTQIETSKCLPPFGLFPILKLHVGIYSFIISDQCIAREDMYLQMEINTRQPKPFIKTSQNKDVNSDCQLHFNTPQEDSEKNAW